MEPAERFRLVDAKLVCPADVVGADIIINGAKIEAIGASSFEGRDISCEGDFLLPGFVELHTDNFEYHLEPRAGTFLPPAIAIRAHDAELAAAGITTAFNALTLGGEDFCNDRPLLLQPALRVLARTKNELRCDHFVHLRCEVSDLALADKLSALASHVAPQLVSVMDHTPGQGQWRNIDVFRRHYGRRYGLDAPDIDALIVRRQAAHRSCAPKNKQLAAEFARAHGAVLASHDDTTAEDIEAAVRLACRISEFPTTDAAAKGARDNGILVIGGAPNLVRGSSSSGNVAAADLVQQNLLDIVSSDYYPASLLAAIFVLHQDFGLPLAKAVGMGSHAPARAAGFVDRGALVAGQLADLVRVRMDGNRPVVVSVWRRGKRIY